MVNSRYPDNWKDIALAMKQKVEWRCEKCGMQCLKPADNKSQLSKSERRRKTLTVHHRNYQPEDNRLENLVCLCSGCHLNYHTRQKGNISIGQLSLNFESLN